MLSGLCWQLDTFCGQCVCSSTQLCSGGSLLYS